VLPARAPVRVGPSVHARHSYFISHFAVSKSRPGGAARVRRSAPEGLGPVPRGTARA